ncbi:hypothetical protein QCA50_008336 [Cerrena zonata]|uniref:C2 domain-containing protein n=1 Tax=Cerrena zonata TaxID=2478898 RepID=A0AAW0G7W7_9APHY
MHEAEHRLSSFANFAYRLHVAEDPRFTLDSKLDASHSSIGTRSTHSFSDMTLPSPQVHCITHVSQWPTNVVELTRQLDLPLPSFKFSEVGAHLSPVVQPLFLELQKSLTKESPQPDEDDSSFKLESSLNLILMTVAILRSYQIGKARQTLFPLLLSGLCTNLTSNVQILLGSPFFIARTDDNVIYKKESGSLPRSFVDASVAVCIACTDDSNVDSSSSSTSNHLDLNSRASDTSSESNHQSSSSSDTLISLDRLFFDPNPTIYGYYNVHIPILVATGSDNITAAVTSALYQRHGWSIDEPMIGVELCDSGLARVHIGWIEYCQKELLQVHVTHASADAEALPALGSYDLTNPLHACALAQFLLSLRAHGESIEQVAQDICLRQYCWQFDHPGCYGKNLPERQGYNVDEWLQNCVAESNPVSESQPTEELELIPGPLNLQTPGEYIDNIGSLETLLSDRSVDMVPNLPPLDFLPGYCTIEKMRLLYEGFTKPVLLSEWAPGCDEPPVRSAVFEIDRNYLIAHHQKVFTSKPETCVVVSTTDAIGSFIKSGIDILLGLSSISIGTKSSKLLNDSLPAWNHVFALVYLDNRDNTGDALQYHVDVRLSGNHLGREFEDLTSDNNDTIPSTTEIKDSLISRAAQSKERWFEHQYRGPIDLDDFMVDYILNVSVKPDYLTALFEGPSDHSVIRALWNRSENNPVSAVCDIVALRRAKIKFPSKCGYNGDLVPFPSNLTFVMRDTQHSSHMSRPQTPQGLNNATHPLVDYLMVPVILGVYKKKEEDMYSATLRLHLFMASAIDMYTHLGLNDASVWGVYIDGTKAEVVLAQRCPEGDRTLVFLRQNKTYELTDPFSLMQFTAFLLRVRLEPPELHAYNFPLPRDMTPTNRDDQPDSLHEVSLVIDSSCRDSERAWSNWTQAGLMPVPDRFRYP